MNADPIYGTFVRIIMNKNLKHVYVVNVEEGKNYSWCSCGKSNNQPFCDSTESDCGEKAVEYTSQVNKDVYFCGCKETANSPLCDCN